MSGKMDYGEFRSVIKGELERKFPGWNVLQRNVAGVNGSNEEHLILVMGNGSILPTMTVRNLYESYLADSMAAALNRFETVVLHDLRITKPDKLEQNMASYEWARDRLKFALYSYADNREYFANTVYYRWLDLMLVLKLDFVEDRVTSFIERSRQKQWSVSDEVLYQDAMHNMQLAALKFTRLSRMLWELSSGEVGIREDEEVDLFVLSNESNRFGAAVIAIPGVLRSITEKLGTGILIILPCSIHEVLVKPVKEKPGQEEVSKLRNIVQEVNKTSVDVEIRLSDNVYIYQADIDRVLIL